MGSTEGGADAADALRGIAEELQAQLVAHRVEVREALADHLARSAERERAVAAALESLTNQLNQFTATLAAEVRRAGDATVAQAVAELGTATRALEGASVDAVAEAVGRVDARVAQLATTVGPTLRELAAARTDDGLVEEVRRLRVAVEALVGRDPAADLGEALAQASAGIRAAVRAEVEDLRGAIEGLAVSREQANLPAALERALRALDQLDTLVQRPDPTPAIERLASTIGGGGAGGDGAGGDGAATGAVTAEQLAAALEDLRRSLLDGPAPASPEDLQDLGRQLAELRTVVDALAAREPPPPAEPVPLALDGLRRQVDAIGRLAHHAVRALQLIEAATVGVSPRLERDREAATAALGELDAARPDAASEPEA